MNNLGTILVGGALAVILFLIVRKLIRDRRAGKTSCGCGCEGCAMHGACHGSNTKTKSK